MWAAQRFANALVESRVALHTLPMLERRAAIRSSHKVVGPQRPWPDQHSASLTVRRLLPLGHAGKLVIVDDIITRGSTLMGCAMVLSAEYPDAEIMAFAAARTLKHDQALPEDPRQPTVGTITYRPGWIERQP